MENVKKILELDISDKKKAKLIEGYLEKKEYPNIIFEPYVYDWRPITYGPITCGSGTIITSSVSYGISTE